MTKNVTYVAVLADVMGSRLLPPKDRARLQDALRAALRTVNRRGAWRPKIAAGFAIARGDEIQGLLKDATLVWAIAHWLRGARAQRPRGRRPLLPRRPRGARRCEATAPGLRVSRVSPRGGRVVGVLLGALLELDPPAAPPGGQAANG